VPLENGTGRRLNPAFIALWEPYLDEGMPGKAVAEIFGVKKHTVYRHYPGRSWSHQQVSEMGTFMRNYNRRMRASK
jgi:hypothetical protein